MPERVICGRCKHVLYKDPDLISLNQVVQMYDGKCPKCGNELSYKPISIKIMPASEKKMKTIPPVTVKINEQKYKTPSPEPVKEESIPHIEHNFLSVFDDRLNKILERFDLYPVSEKFWIVGGKAMVRHNKVLALYLPLDKGPYCDAKHAVRRNIKREVSEYVIRQPPWYNWSVSFPSDVPLERRIEFEERLSKNFDRLEKVLGFNSI